MKGKICIVTGANSGIGKVTALELANRQATVIMICRSKERGYEALSDIKKKTDNNNVHLLTADLSSLVQVKNVAREFKSTYDRLDVLVNNAGGIQGSRSISADGFEMTVALNHIGYFALTHHLLKPLKNASPSRIINVASGAHRRKSGRINFDDPFMEKDYDAWGAYAQSKLMNVMFTYELSRRLAGTGIDVNCMHPGVVKTNFGQKGSALFNVGFNIASPFMLTPEQGADTVVWMATEKALKGVSGKYFVKRAEEISSDYSLIEKEQKRLWELTEKWCKIEDYFRELS